MKKIYSLFCLILAAGSLFSQTTEVFEDESNGSLSFTDIGQVFNITSQAQGPFDIQSNYPGTGWNGTSADHRYIDNDGSAVFNTPVQFTIASQGGTDFQLKSMYLFLSTHALDLNVSGSVTITGKRDGATQFTATASSPFNTSTGVNNGFTFINMATYGGSNNSNTNIDEFIITTTGNIGYVALDAMTWQPVAACTTINSTGTQTNVSCNGGSNGTATVTPTSGTAPYTYSWAPSGGTGATASGLSVGIYTVTITDANGCTGTRNFTITQPTALSAAGGFKVDPTCNGGTNGSATVFASGGTAPYSYSWSPSGGTIATASGLAAGTHTVTVTDSKGCTASRNFIITQPAALTTTGSQTGVSCNGGTNGTATVVASGGTAPYTYSWSPSGGTGATATGLAAGSYTVLITDNKGCTTTRNYTITQPAALSGGTVVTNASCGSDGTINLTPSGGTGPYTYIWSDGSTTEDRTGLTAGGYSVTITDSNGCTATVNATVGASGAVAGSTVVTNVACNGGTTGAINLTPSGGTGPYTYSWNDGPTTQDRTGLAAGTYTVVITDANGCQATVVSNVTQPSTAITGTTVVTNVACFGSSNGAINLTPSGGTGPYTFSWNTGHTTEDRTGLAAGTYTVTITDANGCTGTVNATVTQPASALSGTTVVTNVACNGGSTGSINLTPSGGTPPYTFNWGGGITTEDRTGLTAGSYSVTITDANGCTATVNAVITQPAFLSAFPVAQTNVSCNGASNGSATVGATGGVGTYTYSWSPSGGTGATASGLSAGTYTVTVTDANGCTDTQSFTITQPFTAVSGSTVVTNVACFGGSTGAINLTPSGGTGPYTFSWNTGHTTEDRTGLSAGTYTVTITDANGCSGTVNVIVSQPSAPVSGTTVITSVACFGGNTGAINLTPSGGIPPYTFNWGGGVTTEDRTGLAAGTYTVTITDAFGCTGTVTATVTQPAAPVSGTTVVTNASCIASSTGAINLTPTGGTPPYTYNWGSGVTTQDRVGLAAGTYTVIITDANGCTGTISATVTQPATPVSGTTVITHVTCAGDTTGSINLTPSGGTPPYTFEWDEGQTTEDRTLLTAGTYTVIITDSNNCIGIVSATVNEPSTSVSGTTVVTNVSCNGGSNGAINLTPTGGTGPYTYVWPDNGSTAQDRTGLAAGTYYVYITDANGCTNPVITHVTQPAVLSGTTVITNVSCFGGSNGAIDLTPTGGTAPYTYNWGGGITTQDRFGLAPGNYSVIITDANGCTATVNAIITQPSILNATALSQTNIACNGAATGSATVSVTGGTGAYTYSWSPSGGTGATATGLSAGTYTVTVTDANGCTAIQSFTITQPSALSASVMVTDEVCATSSDGILAITVTGGTTPYSTSLDNVTFTPGQLLYNNLAAGSYTVYVRDANNCTITPINFNISPGVDIQPVVNVTDNCTANVPGNTVTINVNPAVAANVTYSLDGVTYTASNTFTNLAAGNYIAYAKHINGCIETSSFTINNLQPVAATAAVTLNVLCNGGNNGEITITATGGTGVLQYAISPAFNFGNSNVFTGLSAGTYTVIVQDVIGCQYQLTGITITQPAELVANAGAQTNVTCNGGSNGSATVTVTGGTGTYTYSWAPSGGTGATATGLAAGTYTVTVTDANGCTATQSFTITQPTALAATLTTTNVGCPGAADGTATVAVTGGTGAYTYLWAPSGGTGATATGLTAGTYTVTVTDANGCIITQSINVTTTPDVTAPVADVTNLPAITNYCAVLAAEIAIPTATDNCNGTITATTTSPLEYTTEGTYTITWIYDDGNGNTSSQTQTINVLASPLDAVTFNDATVVYNTAVQTIQVASLPAGATVNYSTTPATGTGNGAVNAGVYTVTATVTPPVAASNCDPATLMATLTIERAPQVITFDPLEVMSLENDPDFQLGATASSGLPVYYTYTYTSPQPSATVTPQGFVDMVTSGQIIITAHQDGNENYLPAVSVDQVLVIESSNASISLITVGDQMYDNPSGEIYYLVECADSSESVEVTIVTEANATVVPGHQFTIATPQPGIYSQEITVTSQDGTVTNTYTVIVEKRFNFFDIVMQKFDNVLLVNNNPATNGGYQFITFDWYRDDQFIGTGQYYSVGDNITNLLDPDAYYYVKMTTVDGQELQTCIGQIDLQHDFSSRLYPNPAVAGRSITIETDFPQEELENMHISIYSIAGSLVTSIRSSARTTEVQLPGTIEDATYLVVLETPNIKKTLKVIVHK